MIMDRGLFVLLFMFGGIAFVTVFILWRDGYFGKNMMRHTRNISVDADVISVSRKIYGTKGGSHYEAIVHFSDGSWYRANCGIEEHGLISVRIRFDEDQVPFVVEKARKAHKKVAMRRQSRKSQ